MDHLSCPTRPRACRREPSGAGHRTGSRGWLTKGVFRGHRLTTQVVGVTVVSVRPKNTLRLESQRVFCKIVREDGNNLDVYGI